MLCNTVAIATVVVGDMCVQSNFTAIIVCTTFTLLGWYNRGVLSQVPQENANSHLPEVLFLFTYNAVVVVGDMCVQSFRAIDTIIETTMLVTVDE